MTHRRERIGRGTLAAALAIPFLYPFFFLVSTALRPAVDYAKSPLGFPTSLTTSHLRLAASQAHLGHAMLNSLLAVGVGVVVLALLATTSAYFFLLHRGRLASGLFVFMGALWIVPFVVYIIPLYVLFSDLRLLNNLVVLGVIYAATNLPFGLYFMYAYYANSLPTEVLDAARVDGASRFQEFRRIVFPLSRPALATVAALGFVWTWGDLVVSLIMIQDPSRYTATVAAAQLVTKFNPAIQESAAAALLMLLPMLLVFTVAQRAIIRGFLGGVGK